MLPSFCRTGPFRSVPGKGTGPARVKGGPSVEGAIFDKGRHGGHLGRGPSAGASCLVRTRVLLRVGVPRAKTQALGVGASRWPREGPCSASLSALPTPSGLGAMRCHGESRTPARQMALNVPLPLSASSPFAGLLTQKASVSSTTTARPVPTRQSC
uniref:Uncharacterized protein n=1 Tax=Rousettus aegyptiacus TaxID=9407 RepID=A0A7J8BFQ6_ROUAE|nr:hypothetical protein HJG63_009776 [Rousettus aegyptiacus]